MIKVMHVIPSLGIGGTEKMILELCRGLESDSCKNAVVALKFGGQTCESLRNLGIPVTLCQSPNSFLGGFLDLPRLYFQLKKEISDFGPDIVHTWLTRANVVGRLAAKGAGVSKIVSSLRVMEEEKGYHCWSERMTHSLARVVTVNSSSLKKFAVESIGLPEEKVVLIPNGIRLDSLKVEDTILRSFRKKWVQEGEWVLGAMGRLHRQKGIDIFLQAAKKIAEKVPRCRFLIAGDGPEKENLERLTRSLGLESQVTFCGWVKESLEFISLLDVFVLTSRWEGMPNVVLEAMALNKPVVSTNVGGAEDLIEDGKEGILIPSEDPDACSSAALKLYQDPVLKTKLSQNGSQKIRQRFGMDSMIRSYRSLYESLL